MAKSQQIAPEAAATGLYLVIPATCPPAELASALEAADIACVLLLDGGLDERGLRAAIAALCPLAQAREIAVLLQDRAELAAETGCDGVHLSDFRDVAAARRRLGAEALVGVGVGVTWDASRHDAITAAERGADYVAFGAPDSGPPDPELLGWWQSIMTLPCAAFGAAAPEDCARLARAGADFVAVTPELNLAACQAALEAAPERAPDAAMARP
jgi:thiamine-phosphate pyrophosphorylase